MGNTGVAGQLILGKQADDLRGCGRGLCNRFGDVLRSLAYSRKEYAGGGAFDGTELGMSFGEEVVGVHAGGQHGGEGRADLSGSDGGGKHNHVGLDLDLFVHDEVGGLNGQLSVVGSDLPTMPLM